jgi:hypothetical protein
MNLPQDFQAFESKPVTRHAYQITEHDAIAKMGKATYNIVLGPRVIEFKAYEKPQVGDFIVYTADDIYHCSEATFRERNVVED